jgi:flagellar hook-length control protein FliK
MITAMDISLPVSDSSATGMFSGGASARSVDSDRFSQTLSKEMADKPEQEPVAAQSGSAQQTQPQKQATANSAHSDEHAQADADPEDGQADGDDSPTTENTTKHAEKASETGKGQKKIATQDAADIQPGNAVTNTETEVLTDEHALLASLKMAGNSEEQPAETAKETVTPAALDKATTASTNSVLANGSTNPALLRSNASHNEIFRSLRAQSDEGAATEVGTYAESLLSGKSLQNSGKNLPVGKTDKAGMELNSFLPAGAQDWKYTADTLITAVSDKAAKFEALSTQFNTQSAESFSILNTGTGKTLAAQSAFKSELATQDATYTSLSSDFLAGSEEWCQDFGTKIEWMNNENVTKAELSLHPAELGVLDITINTEDDRISINIVTHSEKSREMLESSMPRLTELLKSQGLALENSNISHNSSSEQQNAHAQQSANSLGLTPDEQQAAELGNMRSTLIRHQGQIDHYV